MTLSALIEEYGSQAALAKALGCDKSYLNRVVKQRRPLGPALAVQIYNVTGHKLGPMAERAA
jgi:plasmid maintenance system antidote protein VapI